jgi:hypothetical protein
MFVNSTNNVKRIVIFMGILYCIGNSVKEVENKFILKELVECVDFDYDGEDEQIFDIMLDIDNNLLGKNILDVLSVVQYEDTVIPFIVVKNAYEELKHQIDSFKGYPYYGFLDKLLKLLEKCVVVGKGLAALGD